MIKKHLLFVFISLLFTFSLVAEGYGPFVVSQIRGKFVYFTGNETDFLMKGRYFRVFRVVSGGFPRSLTDVVPVAAARIYAISSDGGILYFKKGVPEILSKGDKIVIVKGNKITLNFSKRKKRPRVKSLLFADLEESIFESDVNRLRLRVSEELVNLLSIVGLRFDIDYINNRFVQRKKLSPVAGSVEISRVYDFASVSALIGFVEVNYSFLFGPMLGVVNGVNAGGVKITYRYGFPYESFFQISLEDVPTADYLEIDVKGRFKTTDSRGLLFRYQYSTYPEVDHNNHYISMGLSFIKKDNIVNVYLGVGLSGEDYRGPTGMVEWGYKF